MNTFITICIAVIIFLLLGFFVISYYIFFSFLKREKQEKDLDKEFEKLSEPSKNKYKPLYENIKIQKAWFLSLPYESMSIISEGYALNGYYLSKKSEKTVVILHGYKDDALSVVDEIRFYYEMGFNVFIPDIRSHGKSQGKYIGMGSVDNYDIIKWLEVLQNKEGWQCKFLLVGFSMGGALALTLSGRNDLPSSVSAIISHSAFTSLNELVPTVIKIKPQIIKRMLIFGFEMCCKLFAKYGFNENTPAQGVQKAKTPIMIIHGLKDNFVPFDMSEKLFLLCVSEKSYWIDENAGHDMIGWHDKETYHSQIKTFLNKYM